MIFVKHELCYRCGNIFHRKDMEVEFDNIENIIPHWYCKPCYKEHVKIQGYHLCECKNNWVKKR